MPLYFDSLNISFIFKLSDIFFSRVSCMYTREDLLDTLYLIMMVALNVVGFPLIPT